jgi:glycolate oxidase FAD binding subunit
VNGDRSAELVDHVRAAASASRTLRIVGGGSKTFFGRNTVADAVLDLSAHRGILNYEPEELVITARAGTPLVEIESALAERGQILPFEPPHYGANATLGGTIACNLSGPRRPFAGAARDYVLGVEIINGRGELLKFGGRVMKNVAGYDVSRLMCGAYGTLGVLLTVTLKVLPRYAQTITLGHELDAAEAIRTMNARAGQPLPITATAFDGATLYTRLEGTSTAVRAARQKLGGELHNDAEFWANVREQRHGYFGDARALWRLSIAPTSAPLRLSGKTFFEWNGGLRWLFSEETPETIRSAARAAGGHATLFRGDDRASEVFEPLPEPLAELQRNLKAAFDPAGLFNPGRPFAAM